MQKLKNKVKTSLRTHFNKHFYYFLTIGFLPSHRRNPIVKKQCAAIMISRTSSHSSYRTKESHIIFFEDNCSAQLQTPLKILADFSQCTQRTFIICALFVPLRIGCPSLFYEPLGLPRLSTCSRN